MEIEVISDYIAGAALIVSVIAYWDGRRVSRNSQRLFEQEVELLRGQVSAMRLATRQEREAKVSAKMYKEGKSSWRVRIYNAGPADARNVRVVLDDQNSLVTNDAIREKFPMDKLEKGQSVDVYALVHMQSPSKEYLLIRWDDSVGVDRENRVEITL
jgi:hypothetical protein